MDIWIRWCHKSSKCRHCGEQIEKHTPVVIGKLWIRSRRFFYIIRWHPQCWVDQGIAALPEYESPYTGKIPGTLSVNGEARSTHVVMSDEERLARKRLVGRWRQYRFRMRKAVEANNMEYVQVLVDKMRLVVEEIEKVGGVPNRWLEML